MNKWKTIFIHTILIAVAILLANGIQYVILHYTEGCSTINWPWYIPISYILTGFLSSLPTMLLLSIDEFTGRQMWARIGIHFVITGLTVSFCGFIFHWYETVEQYIPILVLYVLIYGLVWLVTEWMWKTDEKKINDVIKDLHDEE